MTFKNKEKEIKQFLSQYEGVKYIEETSGLNVFHISVKHLDDWIKFTYKNLWDTTEKVKVTCFQQKLTEEDFEFIIEIIRFLKKLGFKEEECKTLN